MSSPAATSEPTSAASGVCFYTTIAPNQVRDYMPAVPVMVTATGYWRKGGKRRMAADTIKPVKLPAPVPEIAADSGGFTAAFKLGGRYPFSLEAYLDWLHAIGPRLAWAAMPDMPVEREIAATFAQMRDRQVPKLTLARTLRVR